MQSTIVVVGCGFAGFWSAVSAKRLIRLRNKENDIRVVVISPKPELVIRPRLYEANPATMVHPLGDFFEAAGIEFQAGLVTSIDVENCHVNVQSIDGTSADVSYSRLILAAGSTIARPAKVAGLERYAFDIDSLESATRLNDHFEQLTSTPASPARNTVVICGGGYTGIELATELPARLKHFSKPRVILVEGRENIGAGLGPDPRPVILRALEDQGVEVKVGSRVSAVTADEVILSSGESIQTKTVVWTAGVRATALTEQIPGERDPLGRVHVDENLRAISTSDVLVTGDAAYALADPENKKYALMSCQHALMLGRRSGNNAAADLLGETLTPYSQPSYSACLDLGPWGAVIAGGWERKLAMQGHEAKQVKCFINQRLIYPPRDIAEAFESAAAIKQDASGFFKERQERLAQEAAGSR